MNTINHKGLERMHKGKHKVKLTYVYLSRIDRDDFFESFALPFESFPEKSGQVVVKNHTKQLS
jgi:hypothetical protein